MAIIVAVVVAKTFKFSNVVDVVSVDVAVVVVGGGVVAVAAAVAVAVAVAVVDGVVDGWCCCRY